MAIADSTLDLDPVDWVGKQVQSFREAFWTSTFNNPAIQSLLTVVPGIKAKQQIVILGTLDLVGKTKQLNNCAPDESDQVIPTSEKQWDPEQIEDRFTECWKNLLDKFTVWGLGNNLQKKDLTGTDFAEFLMDRVIDGLVQSIYRIVWFADKNIANVSGGGILKNGVDIRYFNAIDGLWKQFFAVAAEFPEHYVQIPNNYAGVITPVAGPTLTPSTSGGTLAASTTWRVAYSYTNASGETPIGPETVATTTGSTGSIAVATGALPSGATGVKIYVKNGPGAYATYFTDADGNFTIITSTGTAGTPVTINGATLSASQKFTADDVTNQVITNIFQQLVDDADTRLVGAQPDNTAGTPIFFVTRSVMSQYKRERKKFTNIDEAYTRTEAGFRMLQFDGYDVVELDFEDRIIAKYLSNGTSSYLPHRIYYTTIQNIQMGCEEQGSMTNVKAFFVDLTDQYYIDSLYTVDAKEIEDYKVSLAY